MSRDVWSVTKPVTLVIPQSRRAACEPPALTVASSALSDTARPGAPASAQAGTTARTNSATAEIAPDTKARTQEPAAPRRSRRARMLNLRSTACTMPSRTRKCSSRLIIMRRRRPHTRPCDRKPRCCTRLPSIRLPSKPVNCSVAAARCLISVPIPTQHPTTISPFLPPVPRSAQAPSVLDFVLRKVGNSPCGEFRSRCPAQARISLFPVASS